jgi:hypothetical protein
MVEASYRPKVEVNLSEANARWNAESLRQSPKIPGIYYQGLNVYEETSRWNQEELELTWGKR